MFPTETCFKIIHNFSIHWWISPGSKRWNLDQIWILEIFSGCSNDFSRSPSCILHVSLEVFCLFVCFNPGFTPEFLLGMEYWNTDLPLKDGFDTPWALEVFITRGKRYFHSFTFLSPRNFPPNHLRDIHTCSSLRHYQLITPIAKLLSGKNTRAFVVCGFSIFLEWGKKLRNNLWK